MLRISELFTKERDLNDNSEKTMEKDDGFEQICKPDISNKEEMADIFVQKENDSIDHEKILEPFETPEPETSGVENAKKNDDLQSLIRPCFVDLHRSKNLQELSSCKRCKKYSDSPSRANNENLTSKIGAYLRCNAEKLFGKKELSRARLLILILLLLVCFYLLLKLGNVFTRPKVQNKNYYSFMDFADSISSSVCSFYKFY